MAVDIGRWWKYAQAKLSSAVDAENRELDQLEAERAAEVADKPWLTADDDAPTLEEAKARIEWEAEEQRRTAEAHSPAPADPATPPPAAPSNPAAGPPGAPTRPSSGATDGPPPAAPSPPPPVAEREDPDVAAARIELDRQAREGAARLEAIRKELGVDPPAEGGPAPKA